MDKDYSGKIDILDVDTGEVLARGVGAYIRDKKKMIISFDSPDDYYQNRRWVPVLQTEDGYFCPAGFFMSDILAYPMQATITKSFGMGAYFHWVAKYGAGYILKKVEKIRISVLAKHESTMTLRPDKSASLLSEANPKTLDKYNREKISIKAETAYAVNFKKITAYIQFSINQDDISPLHDFQNYCRAFQMYWVINHDDTNCKVDEIKLGDALFLHNEAVSITGRNHNSSVNELPWVGTELDLGMLALLIMQYVSDAKKDKTIIHAFENFLRVRLVDGEKLLDEEPLRFVFSLDGFSSVVGKGRTIPKKDKDAVTESIRKILSLVDLEKEGLDARVYDFYHQNSEAIYGRLSQKPFKERVKTAFSKSGVDFKAHEVVVDKLNDVRQVFVHGKNFDNQDFIDSLYTHPKNMIQKSDDSGLIQISYGVEWGLMGKVYQTLHDLYRGYLLNQKIDE